MPWISGSAVCHILSNSTQLKAKQMHFDGTAQIIFAIMIGISANVRAAATFVHAWRGSVSLLSTSCEASRSAPERGSS